MWFILLLEGWEQPFPNWNQNNIQKFIMTELRQLYLIRSNIDIKKASTQKSIPLKMKEGFISVKMDNPDQMKVVLKGKW